MTPQAPRTREARASHQARRGAPNGARGARGDVWAGIDQSTAMSMELLAGILVWGGIGWLADGWLGTRPWLFVVGTLLGFGAGLYLVWHRAHALEREEEPAPGSASDGDSEPEPERRAARDSP